MDLKITGKLALVTASSRGIGKSIASCLAREGVNLILNGRNEEGLKQLRSKLPNQNSHSIYVSDLAKSNSPRKLIHFLEEKNLYPDIIVHNLGGNLGITNPLCSLSEWHKVFRVNVDVSLELNQWVIPYMQKKKWGRICHVSSISGLENQGPPPYCAAKAALIAYCRSLGRFVAKDNIVMNTVLPGAVMTEKGYWDLASKERPSHVQKFLEERMAIQRFGTPDEIGEIVTFLCSELSSFCVGSSFLVDGGQGRVFHA